MKVLLQGGKVHSSSQGGFIVADVRIHNNFIVEIAPNLKPEESERVIDCTFKYILPGLIDAHVHFRDPGAEHKEDWLSGSKAAVAGGVTTVLDMPNNNPPITTQERLRHKKDLAGKSLVNYGCYILGCVENKNELGSFRNIPGYKVYMGSSTGNYLTDDLGTFAEILENAAAPVVVHAEHEDLLKLFAERFKGTKLHHKMRDNVCAVTSMAEATVMADYFGKKLHIAHMSTKQEVEFFRRNKTAGMSCEVSPHHLFLDEKFHCEYGTYGKMNPPLRYLEDQEALWAGIRDGIVDMVATDHAPHLKNEKDQDFFQAPCGVPGVQTMLPLLLNAVHNDKLTLLDVVRLTSTNPARVFKIQKRGAIEKGFYADLCVVDMNKERTIRNEDQLSKCGWTPFDGNVTRGWPIMTIVNGDVVYEHGQISEQNKGMECKFQNREKKEEQSMNITTSIAGVQFAHPIFNAAGPRCTTLEELEALGESASAGIMTKSCTLESRKGNEPPKYYDFGQNSINSNGLENLGYQEYARLIPDLKKHGKPCIVSVSGMCLQDNLKMLEELSKVPEIDLIELNLSCPNIPGKPQVGYDFAQSRDVLERVAVVCKKPFGVKLPPYFDMAHFKEMAEVLNASNVKFVTCINSLGNGLVIDAEKEQVTIRPKDGHGGVGGKIIKPFGLSNVRKFRELLKPDIKIIGVAGITTGMDVFEYILAGADAVQVGTAFMQEGPEIFARLEREFKAILERKGYGSLAEFRGKLKVIE